MPRALPALAQQAQACGAGSGRHRGDWSARDTAAAARGISPRLSAHARRGGATGRWCPPGSRQWRAAAAPPSGPRRGPPRAAHAAARRRASRAAVSACPRQRGSRRSRWTEVCGGRPPLRLFGCRRRWCGVAWPPSRRVTCGRLPGVRPAGGSSGRRAQWQKQVDRDGGEQEERREGKHAKGGRAAPSRVTGVEGRARTQLYAMRQAGGKQDTDMQV